MAYYWGGGGFNSSLWPTFSSGFTIHDWTETYDVMKNCDDRDDDVNYDRYDDRNEDRNEEDNADSRSGSNGLIFDPITTPWSHGGG